MPASRIIKPINVFEQGYFCLPACCPCIAPNQLRLERFEEGFHNGIIIAVTPSTHRHLKAMFLEHLLIIIWTILGTAIRVVDTPFGRLTKGYSHLQCSYHQITLHTVAGSPSALWHFAQYTASVSTIALCDFLHGTQDWEPSIALRTAVRGAAIKIKLVKIKKTIKLHLRSW